MRAVLRLAGAVEQGSEHPLGRAIVAYAMGVPPRDRVRASGDVLIGQGALPEVSGFAATAGRGVRGRVEGRLVEVLAPDDELPAASPTRCGRRRSASTPPCWSVSTGSPRR